MIPAHELQTILATIVTKAPASHHIPFSALLTAARSHGFHGTARDLAAALDDLGHPSYAGPKGQKVTMGLSWL